MEKTGDRQNPQAQVSTAAAVYPDIRSILFFLICIMLLVLPVSGQAESARFHQGLLTLPVVEDGSDPWVFELALIPETFPPEFSLTYSREVIAPVNMDTPYFLGNLLIIPDILIGGESYWVELELVETDLFRVDSYGLNRSPRPADFYGSNSYGWARIPGEARDIGVGADGTVWVLGSNLYYDSHGFDFDFDHDDNAYDYGLWVLDDHGWLEIPGAGIRLDVGPDGSPWVINSDHEIYHLTDLGWERVPGRAHDIGVGADGSVWVLGTNEGGGGYDVFHLTRHGWQQVPGSGVRIDVDPYGNPWLVNDDDEIYRLENGYWQKLPGLAKDVGIGADGSVWVIGSDRRATGYGIYYWNGFGWNKVHGSARQISVGPDGEPWVVNREGKIYRRF